jgi:hypothetical protein
MSQASTGGGKSYRPAVEIVNGPVPDDHPSHALRLEAAKDLVQRAKAQLKKAEAALAQVIAEQKQKEN